MPSLNPREFTLQQLLQGRLFRIAEYQRAYSWETKHRQDLFNDILEVKKTQREHYLATVVSLARETRQIIADQYDVVDIVDGQQRLTTLIILMKAIHKALNQAVAPDSDIARDIHGLLVKGDEHSPILLQTNHDSSHIFLDYIRKGVIPTQEPQTASDNNLICAIREAEEFTLSWLKKDSAIDLLALIRHKLYFVYHEINDEALVYRVFEVLNSRGLDVKWIDKLKSQLMARIFDVSSEGNRSDAIKEMHVIWQNIYRTLGLRNSLGDEALRFAATLRAEDRSSRILSQEDSVKILLEASKNIASIIETARWLQKVVGVVSLVERNTRIGAVAAVVQARFVVSAIMLRDFAARDELNLINTWERVTFRIFGLGYADSRNKVGDYVRLGYDLLRQQLSEAQIVDRLKELGQSFPIDEIITQRDWNDCYEGWQTELRYLLYRYDEYLSKVAGEFINENQWNKIWLNEPSRSVEHIMPQSSGASYIHHIGNLTMLPPGVNSALGAKAPYEKADDYKHAGIKGTAAVGHSIASTGVWDETAVQRRGEEIKAFIRLEWGD